MSNEKQKTVVTKGRQMTTLSVAVTTSMVTLALPALLAAATNPLSTELPSTPATESSHQLLLAYAPKNSEQAAAEKFFGLGYTYCDAKVLAAFWGEATPYAAKVRLGDKMLRWGAAEAHAYVPAARAQALQQPEAQLPCSFEDGGYTYDDAVLLAAYWGKSEPWGAKVKMAHMLIDGKDRGIKVALKRAKRASANK